MDDLVTWLRAQLDEDERVARLQPPWPWRRNAEGDEVIAADGITVAEVFALSSNQQRNTTEHIARHDPARVLREVEAKRRIVDRALESIEHQGIYGEDGQEQLAEDMLSLLALPYADRPGYRDEWRP